MPPSHECSQRSAVPRSLLGNQSSIDTSTLGTPTGNWPADGCNVNQFFEPQELVFEIALCGGELALPRDSSFQSFNSSLPWSDFAGNSAIFQQTCTGLCYDDWVLGPASNFDTAYFEVQYVRVYGQPGELTVISSGASRSADIAGLFAVLLPMTALLLFAF